MTEQEIQWNEFLIYRSEGYPHEECESCGGMGYRKIPFPWLYRWPNSKPECAACLGTGFALPTSAQWEVFWADCRAGKFMEVAA